MKDTFAIDIAIALNVIFMASIIVVFIYNRLRRKHDDNKDETSAKNNESV